MRPVPFGRYLLLERLNVGGMAEVFLAKGRTLAGTERLVAVKRVLASVAEDSDLIRMFVNEAKIAGQLVHANIAQIYELGKENRTYFIAMEYVHGKDLRLVFDRCGETSRNMPMDLACFVVTKICAGLTYAHDKTDAGGRPMRIVHRDVSPQNVLLSYEGEVKLIDFGIAKAAGTSARTQAGILKGKFGYMSPEQVRGLPLDGRSDVFSAGIILYELLTGERLFLGETDFGTLELVRRTQIAPPRSLNPDISPHLEQIVLHALAKDVDDRYASAGAFRDDLQAFLETSEHFCTAADLASWMSDTFRAQMDEERRMVVACEQVLLPDSVPTDKDLPVVAPLAGSIAEPAPSADLGAVADGVDEGMTYEDEIDTDVYDWRGAYAAHELETPPPVERAGDREAQVHGAGKELSDLPDRSAARGAVGAASGFDVAAADAPAPQHVGPPEAEGRETRQRARAYLVAGLVFGAFCVISALAVVAHRGRTGVLRVESVPPGAVAFIDGIPRRARTPVTLAKLGPGTYLLSVRKPGFVRWDRSVEIDPGRSVTVVATLVALATASIEVRTKPRGAVVHLDGVRMEGLTPMRITQVAPGPHELKVGKSPTHRSTVHRINVDGQATMQLSFDLIGVSSEPSDSGVRRDAARRGPDASLDQAAN